MVDLVEWLREQLDKDERVARAACEYASAEWHADEGATTVLMWPPEPKVAEAERRRGLPVVSDQWRGAVVDSAGNAGLVRHITRHDPARVLREIDAKRQVIEQAATIADMDEMHVAFRGRDILKALALPYADQPGYREEWRP
jgi:hypothetical protein